MMVNNFLFFIQVVLESFPVSSSGNILFLSAVLNRYTSFMSDPLPEPLYYIFHGPTVIVVGLFFLKPWWNRLIGFFSGDKTAYAEIGFCVVADCVTVGWWLLFSNIDKELFPLWVGFLITTLFLFSLRFISQNIDQKGCGAVKVRDGIAMGMAQGLALLPGVSRFATTFVVGKRMGWSSYDALERSFFFEWPLIVAGFLKGVWSFGYSGFTEELLRVTCSYSIIFFMACAYGALWFAARIAEAKKMWIFGLYTAFLMVMSKVMNL